MDTAKMHRGAILDAARMPRGAILAVQGSVSRGIILGLDNISLSDVMYFQSYWPSNFENFAPLDKHTECMGKYSRWKTHWCWEMFTDRFD